jgi:hypothetical protein
MKFASCVSVAAVSLAFAALPLTAQAQSFTEGFNTGGAVNWQMVNNSTDADTLWSIGTAIVDSAGTHVVDPYEGTGFAVVNFSSISDAGDGFGTISNWLISPLITGMKNGDVISFYTTTTPGSDYPDRLELRMSAGSGIDVGSSEASVGSFTTLLTSVNSTLDVGGYPESWTKITVTLSGLTGATDGRLAFRYYVTDGGPYGDNSNIIGVDSFSYQAAAAVPEPATWMMSLGGAALLLGLRRMRAKQQA